MVAADREHVPGGEQAAACVHVAWPVDDVAHREDRLDGLGGQVVERALESIVLGVDVADDARSA